MVLGYVQHRLDSELGNPVDAYLSTMRIGLFMVCAFAIVQAVTNYQDAALIARLSEDLGEAMVGINPSEIQIIMEERGR